MPIHVLDSHVVISPDAVASGVFLPAAFEAGARALGVEGVVAVEECAPHDEAVRLLEAAAKHAFVRAVVGLAPPPGSERDLSALVDRLTSGGKVRGLRFARGGASDASLGILRKAGLVCHLDGDDLVAAAALADRHPGLWIVLERLGRPPVAANQLEPWRTGLRNLARRPNVACGVAGLLAMAEDARSRHEAHLWPFFDVAVDAFGPGRLMFGSDSPRLAGATGYALWLETVEMWIDVLTEQEQARIMGGTAAEVYRLDAG
jgi:L-fuconolactonase